MKMKSKKQKKSKRLKGNNGDETLAGLAQRYLEALEAQGRTSQAVSTCKYALREFVSWCWKNSIDKTAMIDKAAMQGHMEHLSKRLGRNGRVLSPVSINNRMSQVGSFCRWLCRHDYLQYNPVAELEKVRQGKSLPRAVLNESEAEELLSQADPEELLGLRDRALMELL